MVEAMDITWWLRTPYTNMEAYTWYRDGYNNGGRLVWNDFSERTRPAFQLGFGNCHFFPLRQWMAKPMQL